MIYNNALQLDGLHIRVDRAALPKAQGGEVTHYDPARSLFVGNLHFQTKVITLEAVDFSHYDHIDSSWNLAG